MHIVYHSLGEQEHIYATRLLKVRSTTCVALSLLNALPGSTSLLRHDVQSLVNSGAWIDSGRTFQIHVDLILEGDVLEHRYVAKYMEDLGAVLCRAEMWSQLDVSVSFQGLQDELDDTLSSRRLTLIVAPAQEFSLTKSVYGEPLTRNHLKPPIGISCVNLDFINLELDLSRCPSIQPKPAKRKRDVHTKGCCGYTELIPYELIHGTTMRTLSAPDEGQARNSCSLDIGGSTPSHQTICHPSTDLDGIVPVDMYSGSTPRPQAVRNYSFSTGVKRSASPSRKLKFADLVKLVDSSLRGAICLPKTPMSLGVLLSSVTEHPRLEHLSPALFSPGYSQMVVQRTPFISNIASTLSDLNRRVKSPILEQKLRRLQKKDKETELLLESELMPDSFIGTAEARIWAMLQYQAYDETACNKLKPLNPSIKRPDDDVSVGHMLDDMTPEAYDRSGPISEVVESVRSLAAEQTFEIGSKRDVAGCTLAAAPSDITEDDVLLADNYDSEEDLFWEDLEFDDRLSSPLDTSSSSFSSNGDDRHFCFNGNGRSTETQGQATHYVSVAAVDDSDGDENLLGHTFDPPTPVPYTSAERRRSYRDGLNTERGEFRLDKQNQLSALEHFERHQTPGTITETTCHLAPDDDLFDDPKVMPDPATTNSNDRVLRAYMSEEFDDLLNC